MKTLIVWDLIKQAESHGYVVANVESGLELSQLNSSPQVWG